MVTAPVTGDVSYAIAAPVATITDVQVAVIISTSAIGIAFIIAIYKGYEEISYENGRLVLGKKQK